MSLSARMSGTGGGGGGSGGCAAAGSAAIASPATTNVSESRMSVALCLETGDNACRPGIVAFAHFVDERHRVLQQRHLRLEVFHEALLRRVARRLRADRGATLADRLIDDVEVLLQRRRRARIEL